MRFVGSSILAALLLSAIPRGEAADYHALAHPQNMERFGCTLPDASYVLAGSSAPMFVFYADEPVDLTFVFKRGEDRGEIKDFSLDIQEITQREPEEADPQQAGAADFGSPEMMRTAGVPVRHPLTVTFTDEDVLRFEAKGVPVPATFGTYAIILVRTDRSGAVTRRQFLGTVARVPRDNPSATVQNTWILGEGSFLSGDAQAIEMHAAAYERMGIRGLRVEQSTTESWTPAERQAGKADPAGVGPYDWSRTDALYAAAARHKLGIMATLGGMSGDWWHFRVEPTPAVGWTDTCGGYGGSGDWVLDPVLYPRYGRWITAFCERYWNNGQGALWGLENYNEPWEGGGISGWARDCLQYRALQKLIAESARKVSPQITLFAASSVMNTEDKFYSDGTEAMSAYVDVFTDHYVKPSMCYGPLVAKRHGKSSMETESWMANAEYRLPLAVITFLAAGQSRINPWHPRDLFDSMPDGGLMPTPVVVATAALNALTAGRPFEKIVFRDHLPWLFQFGKDDDPRGLVVLYGQLISFGSRKPQEAVGERPWAQIEGADGGTITIDNADGQLEFLDLAGNVIRTNEPSVTLPLTFLPTYIRCAQGPAAVAARIRAATITAKRPVEILPRDFASPVTASGAELVVDLHNGLNRAIQGTLVITAPEGITLRTPTQRVALAAGATQSVRVPVATAQDTPANAYPFEFAFESDAGRATYKELLNAAIAPKATIAVDGNLDDWQHIPGVMVAAQSEQLDPTEAARRPWLDARAKQPDGTFAEVKLAWNDDFLFISARVNDPTPQMDRRRGATRNDDDYFHSAKSDQESPYKEFLDTRKIDGKSLRELGYSFGQVPFVYKRGITDTAWTGDRLQFALDVSDDWHDLTPNTDRVPLGFTAVPDSDYEYAAYLCADGQGEVWRLLAPGVPRVHDYPRAPKGPRSTGAVTEARQVIRQDGSVRLYELAIPKGEIANLNLAQGTRFGFVFEVGNDKGPSLFYGADKAVCKSNGLSLHPYWLVSPNCGVRWTLVE